MICEIIQGMPNPLSLLAPALIPSWRFFDVIAPSPRVEYALTGAPADVPDWKEFRPRPQHVPLAAMFARLVWNPRRNEDLFLVSCAERLVDEPTAHSRDEIFARIARDLPADAPPWLRFRLVFVTREEREVLFVSEPRRLSEITTR